MPDIDATEAAAALAAEQGVDLTAVEGSGAGGRITKPDVEAHLAAQAEYEPEPGEVVTDDAPDAEPVVLDESVPDADLGLEAIEAATTIQGLLNLVIDRDVYAEPLRARAKAILEASEAAKGKA